MAFSVPVFNVLIDLWFGEHTPFTQDADVFNQSAQFYLNSRGALDVKPGDKSSYTPPIIVRLPTVAIANWTAVTVMEIPGGTGRYYRARFKEVMHLGFPNQYLMIVAEQCNEKGQAITRDVVPDPGPAPELPELLAVVVVACGVSMDATAGTIIGAGTLGCIENFQFGIAMTGSIT